MSLSVAFRSPNWLGDAVMATVVPTALHRSASVGRVTVIAPAGVADVFAHSPHVDEIVAIPPRGEVDAYRAGGYDLVLLGPTSFGSAWRAFLAGRAGAGFATEGRGPLLRRKLSGSSYRRGRHQVENYRALGDLVGDADPGDEPAVSVDETWARAADEHWPRNGRGRVALQPGAAFGPAKRWPAARYAEVARRLAEDGRDVAFLGGAKDRGVVAEMRGATGDGVRDLSERFGVGELAAVLRSADLLITNDTGPMHLAAAVGTPCLAVFGSTSPQWTAPRGPSHRLVRNPVECAPCFRRTCPIGTPCLEGIPTDRVIGAAREMLEGTR